MNRLESESATWRLRRLSFGRFATLTRRGQPTSGESGLAHASESGLDAVHIVVDCTDVVMIEVLADYGFTLREDEAVETWLAADARPEISPLPEDYRLSSRLDSSSLPHHMIKRGGPDVETRLCQTSLYRPDLDLVVLDGGDRISAYGLFWFDPETATGLVEPMRTEPDHQQRGLARHVLTSGIDRLAKAGAKRIKIVFEPDNPPARSLYLSVGFEPVKQTALLKRESYEALVLHRFVDFEGLREAHRSGCCSRTPVSLAPVMSADCRISAGRLSSPGVSEPFTRD